jgi:hypothetical protein
MNRRSILAGFLLVALFCAGCGTTQNRSAYKAGKADAKKDVANGVLAVEACGFPMKADGEYVRLLMRRHGIEVRRVGNCIISEEVDEHMRGYNKVAEATIERRFGKDCLSNAAVEAQALYEAKTQVR